VLEKAGRFGLASRSFLNGCRRLAEKVWTFAKTGQSTPPRLPEENWARALDAEKGSLLSLVRGMETEFLATGEGLTNLSDQLDQIQKDCLSLTNLTLGRSQDAAIEFAFQLLKKAEDLVLACYDQYDHVFAAFGELQRWLSRLPKQHDELMRVLLPLNVITISLRIEASRHPAEVQEVFSMLASNMNQMVSEVRGTLERQFAELAASEQIARRLMEQISASVQLHRNEIASTLETSRRRLRVLSEALAGSGGGASDLTRQNQAVTRHIGSIVMALQCQDITRQKIEHVSEAMDEMSGHLDDSRLANSGGDSDPRQFVFRAAQIQLHQVQNVFDELNHAAGSLTSGMTSLRRESGAAAEVALNMGGTTLGAKVASQSKTSIGEILAIIKQAVQRIADIRAAFEPLQARFINCANNATELARDVRYAALNAQLFAIHARNGATLEVLAGRMLFISEDTIQQVQQMGAALGQTDEMISSIRQRLEDFQCLGLAELEVLTNESALSQQKLSDLEGAIPVLIQGISQQQGVFARSVDAALANVQFPVAVAEASSRSSGFFQTLVAWAGQGGSEVVCSAASRKIDSLKDNYTMESERHAHTAALKPALASVIVPQPSIEMFDELESKSPAAADSLGDIALPSQRTEEQPRLAELSEVAATSPLTALPPNSEKAASSDGLGDNVEIF
jgi:hypothetical protein